MDWHEVSGGLGHQPVAPVRFAYNYIDIQILFADEQALKHGSGTSLCLVNVGDTMLDIAYPLRMHDQCPRCALCPAFG